jgi:hypothetical protein
LGNDNRVSLVYVPRDPVVEAAELAAVAADA